MIASASSAGAAMATARSFINYTSEFCQIRQPLLSNANSHIL